MVYCCFLAIAECKAELIYGVLPRLPYNTERNGCFAWIRLLGLIVTPEYTQAFRRLGVRGFFRAAGRQNQDSRQRCDRRFS